MKKEDIRALITHFFEHDYPKEAILKFQYWLTHQEDRPLKDEVMNELWEKETAEADEYTLSGLQEMNNRIKPLAKPVEVSLGKRLARIAATLLLPLLGAAATYYILSSEPERAKAKENIMVAEYIVHDGEMQQVVLPDNSTAWINAGTMLVFSQDPKKKTRTVFLNGEATFDIRKDKDKPFFVKSQHLQIEALGTKFNVNTYSDSGISTVTLEEGMVRVSIDSQSNRPTVLLPNEQLVYNYRSGRISKHPIDAQLVSKWKEGYLVFHDAPFEDVMRAIERRFSVTINYDIRKYGGGSFSIKYAPYEKVEQVLDILQTLNPDMQWNKEKNTITIR